MALNPDGTADCTKCGATLPGAGVIHGLLVSSLNFTTGALDSYIFCYANGCAGLILAGHVNH
jgi:hypothetical protein